MHYPPEHHPVFFLRDALHTLGVDAVFNGRDERTLGCWGLIVEGKPFVWLIDNRWPHEAEHEDPAALELIKRGVLVTCAQLPDADRVGAKWLPLAITPGYRFEPRAKVFDVGFIGYVRDNNRAEMLRLVASRYTTAFSQGCFGDSAVSDYWQSKVGLNVPTDYGNPLAYDINMRVFEILATGAVLVTNWLPALHATELGIITDEHCVTYCNPNELPDAIAHAIRHPEIGVAGMELALQKHTYADRAKQVMQWLAL